MTKGTVITVNKSFTAGKVNFTEGETFQVWMEGNEKANIMLVKLSKGGKQLSLTNMKNVKAISIKHATQAVEKEFVTIK